MLSDALLIASTRWRRIAAMENPLAYVHRIVVTTLLSNRRKHRRRRTEPTADTAVLDRPQVGGHETIDQRDEIQRLLATLTPQQRAAVVLRYLHDRSDDDIAAVLGCSTGTVRSHLSHARSALRFAADPQRGGTR